MRRAMLRPPAKQHFSILADGFSMLASSWACLRQSGVLWWRHGRAWPALSLYNSGVSSERCRVVYHYHVDRVWCWTSVVRCLYSPCSTAPFTPSLLVWVVPWVMPEVMLVGGHVHWLHHLRCHVAMVTPACCA